MSVRLALRRARWAGIVLVATALFGCQSLGSEDLAAATGFTGAADSPSSNWQVERYEIGADRYVFALKKNRFASGGDGEAMQALLRCARALSLEQRYSGFEVIEFSQGIESRLPLARRVSRGVVQFERAP